MADVNAHMTEEPPRWTILDTSPLAMLVWCWLLLYWGEWPKAAAAFALMVWMLGWDIARSLRQRRTLTINTTVTTELPPTSGSSTTPADAGRGSER